MKKIVAKLLKKATEANVASVSGSFGYQPEVPEAVKKDE
ncbi:cyclic lactone autoinducer peptide [Sporohalobacter salinus]|nr:cyclic lactone autoinducer peptide [Sporohalobacter salinus]MBM7623129.1 cyclic lactone autoinducer peptide [Sporohalobacter salinus]